MTAAETKRRICVITGTRAEFGLLEPVVNEISRSKKLSLCLIVAGMHLGSRFGNTLQEVRRANLKPDALVHMLPKGNGGYYMADALARGIQGFSKVFRAHHPDVVLVLGDRDEALAAALSALHMGIPVAHIHGGDAAEGAIDESIRHALTKIANIHFAATERSKLRILKMGEDPKFVFKVGSPAIDSIVHTRLAERRDLFRKYQLNPRKDLMLALQHPVTTEISRSSIQMETTLMALVKTGMPCLIIGPNSDSGNLGMRKVIKRYLGYGQFRYAESIPHREYLSFLAEARVLVGNSSSGIIESASFGIPVVNIGTRQKGRETPPNVITVDHDFEQILGAIEKALHDEKFLHVAGNRKNPYGDGNASKRIVRVLESIPLDLDLMQKATSG